MLFLQADHSVIDEVLRPLESERAGPDAEIACHNGPKSHIIIGSANPIEFIQQHIEDTPYLRTSVRTKNLNVINGSHSKFTEPISTP